MNYLKLVETYVTEYYQEYCNSDFTYHNIDHVKEVVCVTEKIGKKLKLESSQIELIKIAAWFHDIGHFKSKEEHEKISARFAKVYLELISYPIDRIETVLGCIKATEISVEPTNLLEKIIKDADLFHLGSSKYFAYCDKLFNEIVKRKICSIDYNCWTKASIKFFEKHKFFTDYAKELYEKQKNKNLEKLNAIIN